MNKPKILNLEITKKCNLNCKHCGVQLGGNNDLTNMELNQLIDDASEIGCQTIIIAGGEPFLSENIWSVLTKASENNLKVSILSNGLLINEKICKKLSEFNNIEFVRLSLEYPSNEMMKDFRGGNDIVNKVIENLRLFKTYGIDSGVGMTILPNNIKYIKEISQIAYENGAKFFRAIPVVPTGEAKDMDINESFYIESLKEVIKVSKNYQRYLIDSNSSNITTSCPAGYSSISVSSDGFLGLCPLIDYEKKLGNIRNQSFASLYKCLNNIKDSYNSYLKENCKQCDDFQTCKGGCLAEIVSRPFSINQDICVKSIVSKTRNTFNNAKVFNENISFASALCEVMNNNNIDICFRALPIWTIFF